MGRRVDRGPYVDALLEGAAGLETTGVVRTGTPSFEEGRHDGRDSVQCHVPASRTTLQGMTRLARTLGEVAARLERLEVRCTRCGRAGRLRTARLRETWAGPVDA